MSDVKWTSYTGKLPDYVRSDHEPGYLFAFTTRMQEKPLLVIQAAQDCFVYYDGKHIDTTCHMYTKQGIKRHASMVAYNYLGIPPSERPYASTQRRLDKASSLQRTGNITLSQRTLHRVSIDVIGTTEACDAVVNDIRKAVSDTHTIVVFVERGEAK